MVNETGIKNRILEMYKFQFYPVSNRYTFTFAKLRYILTVLSIKVLHSNSLYIFSPFRIKLLFGTPSKLID